VPAWFRLAEEWPVRPRRELLPESPLPADLTIQLRRVPLPAESRLAPQRSERQQQQEQPPGLPELLPPERLAKSPFLREPSWLHWLRICRVVPPRRRKE